MREIIQLIGDHWRGVVEILILALGIYQIYRAFRATRGARILVALASIWIGLTLMSRLFSFEVISWIVTRAGAVLTFVLIVIFQPELRNALAKLGSSRFFLFSNTNQLAFVETFADAVIMLSKKRFGALFAIQRSISLKPFLETGVELDALFTPELAMSVFFPKSPLHDGGMIIAQDRVAGAACVFPVSQRDLGDRSIGLRHRAALGVSEESDCIVVVVSEETGTISFCIDGEMKRCSGADDFRKQLADLFLSIKPSTDEKDPHKKLAS